MVRLVILGNAIYSEHSFCPYQLRVGEFYLHNAYYLYYSVAVVFTYHLNISVLCFFPHFFTSLRLLQLCPPVNSLTDRHFTLPTYFTIQNKKLRIIRIEFEPNLTDNWELSLTNELRRSWTKLFLQRKHWMLRPPKKRPV